MIHNPSNLYSGGNVVLDSTPYLKLALQQKAKKQALEEASNQYFDKLPDKLNTVGARTKDLEDPEGNGGIIQDIETWRLDGMKNKSEINKGGMARVKHLTDFDKIIQKVNKSKGIGKEELEIGNAALSVNGWKPRESDHPVLDAMSKSIYNPKHYKADGVSQYSRSDLSISAAPYNAEKQQQFDKVVLNGITPQRDDKTDPILDPLGQKVLNTHKYKPEDIYAAAQRAAQVTDSDKTMYYKYEDLLDNPDDIKTASEALSQMAGVKVLASTPQQMAAGLTAHNLANHSELKEEKDVDAANKFKQKMQDDRLRASMARTKLVQNRKDARVKLMNGYEIDDIYGEVTKNTPLNLTGPAGYNENFYEITNLSKEHKEDLLGKPTGQKAKFSDYKHDPIEFNGKLYVKKNDDGTISDKNGDVIDDDQVAVNTFTRTGKLKKSLGKGELKINQNIKSVTQKGFSLNASERRKQ